MVVAGRSDGGGERGPLLAFLITARLYSSDRGGWGEPGILAYDDDDGDSVGHGSQCEEEGDQDPEGHLPGAAGLPQDHRHLGPDDPQGQRRGGHQGQSGVVLPLTNRTRGTTSPCRALLTVSLTNSHSSYSTPSS